MGASLFPSRVSRASEENFERNFSQLLISIIVDNPTGITELQTRTTASVRVMASRADSGGAAFDSEVQIESPAPDNLKITVRPRNTGSPIKLTVYAPPSINVAVRSITGSVSIIGVFAGLSVNTESTTLSLTQSTASRNC